MANFFDTQANFTNPSYATPEQLANARAYADALTKRSGEDAKRPTGAIANGIDALTAALMRNNANTTQQQAAESNARDYSTLISQLQSRQNPSPEVLGHLAANPMASPEARAWATKLISPEFTKSQFGEPAYQSPATGVQAAPIHGPYTPAYEIDQGAGDVHQRMPVPAPTYQPQPPAINQSRAPVASSPKVWGDNEAQAAGLYPPSSPQPGAGGGAPGPAAVLPPAAAPAIPNTPLTLDQLAAKGREFSAQKAFTQGGAEAVANVQKADIAASTDAPTIKRVAGTMLNDLQTHGDKMTFGPTAQWSNDIKRVAANYAPGFMKDQMEALASADSFDKMSAQLTTLLSRAGGGTDAQLFNNMKSVPGSHNSKEGAEALLKMTLQVADQQQALRQYTSTAKNAQEYEALRNDFYQKNPIVNPITGNPIKLDLEKEKQNTGSGGFKIIGVRQGAPQ